MMDYIVQSQVISFGMAFIVVFLLIGLLFRSMKMAALSVLPNVLPVFVTLGVMGVAGINLDVATVTITAILIGIVVDDTIHYLHRYRAELKRADGDFDVAARETALGAGRAIGATTLIFTLGFLILAFASVKSIVYFGLLTGLAMVVAMLADLLVMPAILCALQPKLVDGK
jgi:predicted RND superfamily exporter protein